MEGARRVDGVEGASTRLDTARARTRGDVTPSRSLAGSVHRLAATAGGTRRAAGVHSRPAGARRPMVFLDVRCAGARRRARSFRGARRPTWSLSGPCSLCNLSCLCALVARFWDVSGRRDRIGARSGPRAEARARRGRPWRRRRGLKRAPRVRAGRPRDLRARRRAGRERERASPSPMGGPRMHP